ncbi:MAG TPA: diguanylate cyclase, partial [Novosphingobium sp.]|nr:diguanylate cyclase [Novosphingobium sp.]
MPVLAVLGLSDQADGDWARLRGLQYSSLAANTVARLLAHGIAALATAGLFFGKLHVLFIVAWLAVLGCTLWQSAQQDRALVDADRRRMTREEVNRQNLIAIGIALAWVLPVGASNLTPDSLLQLELWTVLGLLMTVSAIVLPAVPLSTLLFTGIVGGAAMVSFALSSMFDMALLVVVYCLTVTAGSLNGARNYLIGKVAEAAMAEKSEVVSLLLREFEEGEADWLWQIDASRRVRSVSPRFAFALGMEADEIDG